MKYFVQIALIFLLINCKKDDKKRSGFVSNKVIILVIDGPRYSETWGSDFKQYIPRMKELSSEGTIYTNFYNDGGTYTNAGHTAITTGVYQSINNSGLEQPHYPSIFQYYNEQVSKTEFSNWIVSSKDKLEILSDCNIDPYNGNFNPKTNCGINGNGTGYRSDATTFEELKRILINEKPELTLVNLKEPDASGHSGDWNSYINGIRQSDEYMYKIFNFINSYHSYKGKTTLFVTNDHGRHLDGIYDGFKSHGDGCEGCRHINLFVSGPGIKKDTVISQRRELRDIPATISSILNFEMKYGDGQVMTEIFD
ncbi:alkaline phosphatase family protein [Flavobacteriales bacterium]|nr:alkaline phosphatase family protein [Flavobacteriales bacterium]